MILRLLVIVAVLYLLWRLVRHARARFAAGTRKDGAEDRHLHVRSVRCARCGLFLPESDALEHGGRHYCSVEHRDAMRGEEKTP